MVKRKMLIVIDLPKKEDFNEVINKVKDRVGITLCAKDIAILSLGNTNVMVNLAIKNLKESMGEDEFNQMVEFVKSCKRTETGKWIEPCPYCNKELSEQSMWQHKRICPLRPERKER